MYEKILEVSKESDIEKIERQIFKLKQEIKQLEQFKKVLTNPFDAAKYTIEKDKSKILSWVLNNGELVGIISKYKAVKIFLQDKEIKVAVNLLPETKKALKELKNQNQNVKDMLNNVEGVKNESNETI